MHTRASWRLLFGCDSMTALSASTPGLNVVMVSNVRDAKELFESCGLGCSGKQNGRRELLLPFELHTGPQILQVLAFKHSRIDLFDFMPTYCSLPSTPET